jgi:hypothetical protein
MALGDASFVAGPSLPLIAWGFYVLAACGCGTVTASKSRWGWFALGLLSGGLLWFIGAFAEPARGSLWARRHGTAETK